MRVDIERVARRAHERGTLVVLMPAGNVGHAPFFLPPASWLMTWRSRRLQAMAATAALRHGALHVNLFRESADDPFVRQPHMNAADGLHPADPAAHDDDWTGHQTVREKTGPSRSIRRSLSST